MSITKWLTDLLRIKIVPSARFGTQIDDPTLIFSSVLRKIRW
jgi:hypothetical protein